MLDAFKIINDKPSVDLLITDLNLPERGIPNKLLKKYYFGKMGGAYIIDEVYKNNPRVNVIISTASDWHEFKDLINEDVVGAVITKPYRLWYFESVMEEALLNIFTE